MCARCVLSQLMNWRKPKYAKRNPITETKHTPTNNIGNEIKNGRVYKNNNEQNITICNAQQHRAPNTSIPKDFSAHLFPKIRITKLRSRQLPDLRSGRSVVFQKPRWPFPSVSRFVVNISSSSEMSIFATKFHEFWVHDQKCLWHLFSVHVMAGDARPGPTCRPNIAWLGSNTPGSNEL